MFFLLQYYKSDNISYIRSLSSTSVFSSNVSYIFSIKESVPKREHLDCSKLKVLANDKCGKKYVYKIRIRKREKRVEKEANAGHQDFFLFHFFFFFVKSRFLPEKRL